MGQRRPLSRPLTAAPKAPTRTGPPAINRHRGVVTACALVSALLVLLPPVVTAAVAGPAPYTALHTGFPGLDVAVLTAIGQGIGDLSSMVTIGVLLSLLFFRDARGRSADTLGNVFELSVLRFASGVWATSSAAMVFFEMLSKNGFPFSNLTGRAWPLLYESSAFPKAWTISFAAAFVTFFASLLVERWSGLLIPLWASCFGVLAPVAVGQILVGPDHDFAWDTGVYQTLVTNAMFGVLLVAAVRIASGRLIAPEILIRMFKALTVTLIVVVAADVLLAWFKLSGTGLFDSVTGWQIVARSVFLAILASVLAAGQTAWRRRRLVERHVSVLMAITMGAISGWVGVSSAMTRIPPPQYFVPTSISQVFLGFEVDAAPTPLVLFTHWRPNILFLVLAIAAATVYLVAVRNLRRRGDAWPVGRTIAWMLGWIVFVFVTSSGFGKYSAPDFGIHMVVHMSLNMLAPILLVMGGVVTLLLRATSSNLSLPAGPHDWLLWILQWRALRFVYNPLFVFILFVSSYYGLYFSGIFGEYMRFHWAHQLMNMHFLIAGYLFYGLVIGVDRPPRPLPHIGKLGFALAAMPFHAFFGVILMTRDGDIVAENFYRYLDLPWADLPASQYFGGGVAWAGGELPLLLVIVTLAVQWSRQDAKDARRKDRHFDTGRDDEFDAYNRMLETLTARQAQSRPTLGGPHVPKDTNS